MRSTRRNVIPISVTSLPKFRKRAMLLMSRIVPEGEEDSITPPDHFRIWPDDARQLLKSLPDGCLDRAYLMFPDPWPKARHAKRRFIHPENIRELARLLKPGAIWRVASDHPVYQDWVFEIMGAQDLFDAPPPAQGERPEGWSPTRYEAKATAKAACRSTGRSRVAVPDTETDRNTA